MEIKMSTNEVNQNNDTAVENHATMNMECVNRITKLPVVESTINTATTIYGKVKDYNSLTNWTLSTAENTVNKAVEIGKPLADSVAHQFEGPIKKVDGYLCSGLDYVEAKIPAVKLPPEELLLQIYTTTKEYVNNTVTPAVQSACAKVQPAVKTAREVIEPAMQVAKHAVEPALQNVRQMAEPLVHPAVEKATALKDYGTQKVGEFLHLNHNSDNSAKPPVECADCIENSEKKEKAKENSK